MKGVQLMCSQNEPQTIEFPTEQEAVDYARENNIGDYEIAITETGTTMTIKRS